MLLNTQDKAIQAYNLAQQALDEIENLPAGGGSVQSVNGELPDQNGNVTVDTGVMTVNGVSPDADGEVTITAGSNITITPDAGTNSIEISAEGGSLTATSPIQIVNGDISLKGWIRYTDADWTIFVDSNNLITEDLLVTFYKDYGGNGNYGGNIVIPKGCPKKSVGYSFSAMNGSTGSERIYEWKISDGALFNNQTMVAYLIQGYLGLQTNGSGINQTIGVNMSTPSYLGAIPKIISATDNGAEGIRLYRRA